MMFKLKLLFVTITTGLVIFLVSRGDLSRDFAIGWATGISVGVGVSEFLQRMRR